jgi:hypothetical protein
MAIASITRNGAHRRALPTPAAIAGAILVVAVGAVPAAAHGPSEYSDWGAPTAVTEANTTAHDGCPIESPNRKQLYVASTRPGGYGKNDIWVAERANEETPWGPMTNLGSSINTADHEFCPTPLGGGWLLFVSDRAACGATPGMTPPVGDIYLTRQQRDGSWTTPRHLGCVADGSGPNFTGGEFGPSLVTTHRGRRGTWPSHRPKGETYLYFSSTGTGTDHDIYRSRLGSNGSFGTPQPVTELNSSAVDQMPNVSADGTEVVFASSRGGNMDIWTSTLDRSTGLWSSPVPVTAVNTDQPETRPSLSRDGTRLYFGRGATADVFVSTRVRQHD